VTVCAENQRAGTTALAEAGALRALGDSDEVTEAMLADALLRLIDSPGDRQRMRESGLEIMGASTGERWDHLLGEILTPAPSQPPSRFALRPVQDSDLEMMHGWRNSPRVRECSSSSEPISLDEHMAWWAGVDRSRTRYHVFSVAGRPVGIVYANEIEVLRGSAMWGFYIGETDAGHLSGTRMCYLGLESIFRLGIREVGASVLRGNERSLRLHERLGFASANGEAGGSSDNVRLTLDLETWQGRRRRLFEEIFEEE
jgi:RimJ/RimL family protein N-acetyltransferase